MIEEKLSPKDNVDDNIIQTHHGQGVCQHNGYPYEGHACTQGMTSIPIFWFCSESEPPMVEFILFNDTFKEDRLTG